MSFTVAIIIAFIQADVQVAIFMHAGESEDKTSIYTHFRILCSRYYTSYFVWYGLMRFQEYKSEVEKRVSI